jgi:CheY-like chemotaxis protein
MNTPMRILIIEDNTDDAALLHRQLKKAQLNKHIKTLSDGGEALSYITDERFATEDLAAIFLDLHLPKVTGLQLLETIRSEERLMSVPVIVMTSSNSPEELERCRELGVACFVSKPLTFSSFAKAFADTFHARRSRLYSDNPRNSTA